MTLKELALRTVQSLNPNTYSDLAEEKMHNTLRNFLKQFYVLFVIMAILFIPAYFVHADAVTEKLSSFTSAQLEGNFSASEAITLVETPKIVYDMNATGTQGALVTLGSNEVYYKRFWWFGQTSTRYDELFNFSSVGVGFISFLALFMLPAIIFWSGVFILVKLLLMICIFTPIFWICIGAFRAKLTLAKTFKISLYASVPTLLVEMLLFPFWRNGWVTLGIFVLFFAVGCALLSQRRLKKIKE